jgi:SAM-dependent methyltransferase
MPSTKLHVEAATQMLSKAQLSDLLTQARPPEYIEWNRERIVSCIHLLQSWLPLSAKRTLDLGHDPHIGLLLVEAGADLIGNVAPQAMTGVAAVAPRFELAGGAVREWKLTEFDFEASFPHADGTFDLVTALEVIEHVVGSPRAFLSETRRVLKPGGHLFVSTPNINSWAKLMRQFAHAPVYDSKPYSQDFGPRHPMCHVYEYTPWELKELLRLEGFDVLELRTWDPYPSDPKGVRPLLARLLVSASLACCGYVREAALLFKDRGHNMAVLARVAKG